MRKPILLFLLIFTSIIYSQSDPIKITGKVVDNNGDSIPGATVTFDKNSVTTDIEGKYSINVKNSKSLLKFSFIGYEPQVKLVGNDKIINVKLVDSNTVLDDVVVIGYGTQKRSKVTAAVSKYQNEKLNEIATSNVISALQGKISGVSIQNQTSEAGADSKITIRGAVSVSASNEPLIVVDGQPYQKGEGQGLNSLNMDDVLSVEVLKDASSAAIYGSRGANGVIIVTTKSGGKSDKIKFSFKHQNGVKVPVELYDIMTTTEYTKLLFKERDLKALDPTVTTNTVPSNITSGYLIEQELLGGKGTDYQREALRTGTYSSYNLSASGGTKSTKFYVSLGHNSDEGMQKFNKIDKYTLSSKLNVELSKKVKMDVTFNPSFTSKETPAENFTNFVRYPSFLPVYHTATTAAFVTQPGSLFPNIKPGDLAHPRHFSNLTYPSMNMTGLLPDGSIKAARVDNPFSSAQNNPVGAVSNQEVNEDNYRLLSGVALTINLAKGLDFKTFGSLTMRYLDRTEWANANANGDNIAAQGLYRTGSFVTLLSENTLNYKKEMGKHSFDLLAGYTAEKTRNKTSQVTGTGYPSDYTRNIGSAASVVQSNGSLVSNVQAYDVRATQNINTRMGLVSYLSRANYSYDDKYILSASIRADGSTMFSKGNQWGYFPAASIGWKVNKESFLKEVDWLSKLLLRASYGSSGNNAIGLYNYADRTFTVNYPTGIGSGTTTQGLVLNPGTQSNNDITWELTNSNNVGFDLSLFKNKINLTVDGYITQTKQLLLEQPSLAITGNLTFINNIGSVRNKGIEIELNTTNIRTKNFKWTTQANLSHTENKVRSLGKENVLRTPGERTEAYQSLVGDPLIQFYGYKTDGVWLSQADIDAAKVSGLTSNLASFFTPGGLKLVDVNGDKVVDTNDRVVTGNPYPDFIYGLTNTFTLNAFDFSLSIQGSQGGELINGDANYNEVKRYGTNYNANRWISAANPGDGKTPYDTIGFNWMLTDYVVENASYVCIKDVSFGYNLPTEYAKKLFLNGLRLYMSGQNLLYYWPKNDTKKGVNAYRGINPEARSQSGVYTNALIDGYQRGAFPIARTVLFGIEINF